MSAPDWFLVAWWVVALAIGIPTFILVRRSRLLDRRTAMLSYLKEGPHRRYPMWRGMEMPGPMQVALLVSIGLLVVGAVALFFMDYWTRPLLLNSQIFMVIIGAGMAMVGLSAKAFARVPLDWPRVVTLFMRCGFVLFGAVAVAAGGIASIGDIALPRRAVEGHVDNVRIYRWRLIHSRYLVMIDGKSFRSTFEAFVNIQPNRQVHVEVGAGSGVILAADDNALKALDGPR